jgi:hypothetical protein
MALPDKVLINWFGPYTLESLYKREAALDNGIYAIYRRFGNKETLLYIGKTERNILQRINEHEKDWLFNVKGHIIVRIGKIVSSTKNRFSSKRLSDVESLLIVWHCPPENTSCTVFYRGRFNLEIINTGRRGIIDKSVKAENLVWA